MKQVKGRWACLFFRFPVLSALKNNSGKKRDSHDKRGSSSFPDQDGSGGSNAD
ncbi:hypothetical protein [Bathymodiolus platifrons methanotrophic gill symbiont]|uniref:hypothetical protein n=1 Tax=Bathymodiolus platifrons methanotrophic gill symbiont TaxID=113268 RepID=UPI0030B830CD